MAEIQDQRLWRAGVPEQSPLDYQRYRKALRRAKDIFIEERERFFSPLRDYDRVRGQYRSLLIQGGSLLGAVRRQREAKTSAVNDQFAALESKIQALDLLAGSINEGRLARRNLTKAQLLRTEADALRRKGRFDDAQARLFDAGIHLKSAAAALRPVLSRYADRQLVTRWRNWVDDTVRESRETGGTAIVVIKVERNLTIYKKGVPYRTYTVGLGRNGMFDKLYSGDNATPEGKYHIVEKVSHSRYNKALLINYPNEEDWKQYWLAKKRGLIPPRAGIGGWLEIHGGGDDRLTYGCVALDDRYMEELYAIVSVGTPVTIVGSTDYRNILSQAVDAL